MKKGDEIVDILTRGVGGFVDPTGAFKEKLTKKANGEDVGEIIIKFGVDPTRPDIHLGHAVVFRKLRQFQNLGCKIIFLIGDFTVAIGDPTGKSKVRPEINQKEVENNVATYLAQVGKILKIDDPKLFSWIRNSDWFTSPMDILVPENFKLEINGQKVPSNSLLAKTAFFENTRMQKTHLGKEGAIGVNLVNMLWNLKHITEPQLIERDMFQDRLKSGSPLFMHEMMYPVLQGLDSVCIYRIYGGCDMEIGGTDQTFNMLMGRNIMKANNQPEQAVMSMEILVGTDGKEKMSKSLDNYIGITDEPNNMFGKVMSINDSSIPNFYELCTVATPERIKEIKAELKKGKTNPRDLKMALAEEIVATYHGKDKAISAREAFINTFQKKEIPDDVMEFKGGDALLGDILHAEEIVESKTEWRRLIDRGAVKRLSPKGEQKIIDPKVRATPGVYKIGKKRFIKIV
ncbi:MAG: tyrosine--tRNA ligase [Candidatus Pacebacteria bacterium]|nr:tyrosine--tRNA ligase [Candidatus Paceibacterota bacterium]